MFLKEFAITRFGPLSGGELQRPGPFTLFFAPNEEGKTLTIDALLKMLFGGREMNAFKGARRVQEKPEGYLVIEKDQKEFKFPRVEGFSTLFHFSALEFRNTFLVRDSDLAIASEEDFYRGVTGRLTGMRTVELNMIKENLQALGGITAGGDIINTAPEKLKEKYAQAQKLLAGMEALLGELEAENHGRLEEDLARLEERQREIKVLLQDYNAAYNRERYEKGRDALFKLKKSLDRLTGMKVYSRQDYEAWQRAELNRDHLRADIERLENERAENKKQRQEAILNRDQKKKELQKLEYVSSLVRDKIDPALEQYNLLADADQKDSSLLSAPFVKKTAAASAAAFFIALIGVIIYPEWWLLVILFGSLSTVMVYGLFRFRWLRRKAELDRIEARICAASEVPGINAADVKTARAAIGSLHRDLELGREVLKEAENEVRWLDKEFFRLKEELRERDQKIRQEEAVISKISLSSGVETLDRYHSQLEEKQSLAADIERQNSVLTSHFGPDKNGPEQEQMLLYWEDRITGLEEYANRAKNLRYDQSGVDHLKAKLDRLEGEINRIGEKITRRGDQLRVLEKEINDLFQGGEGYLPCQTTVDLETACQKVRQWLEKQEGNRNKALVAIEALNRVAAAEEQKINVLFGKDKPVSKYFEAITGGRYREVFLESPENRVMVLPASGTALDARSLSGGAYDQLYFSIRLALGDSLLRGDKGFFIFDDPFIKADGERLKKMIGMLAAISREGWQIIYFSAKDEVKAALKEEIETGWVRVCML